MSSRKGNTFIISAPSGAGKTTLIELLLSQIPTLFFSISHTTRPPREGETDGVEYYFVAGEQFRKMIEAGEFLEWAEVHGYSYGTSRRMLELAEEAGKDLLLDVDVQGAARIKQQIPDAVTIFILPPSFKVLRDRLVHRQKDSPQTIARRIENARAEIREYKNYDYIIINEDLASAFENLAGIVRSQHFRRDCMQPKVQEVIRSFESAE